MRSVLIESQGYSRGTTVTDLETGMPIHGVVSISIDPITVKNSEVTAQVGIVASLAVQADVARWSMADPITGETKIIKRIEFEDGSLFEA